ncbi:uncharacterized protein LOC128959402 [Oppia nitens]|uniref:uncharacterized protein LOC128959402 n=1 Tax=Oppia nitens TaxID=1686743 RepID=UPI0023D99521|nr:uncharacterized protein LOC128959402 [Oppia nitens]
MKQRYQLICYMLIIASFTSLTNQINTLFVTIWSDTNFYTHYPHAIGFNCRYNHDADDTVQSVVVLFKGKPIITVKRNGDALDYKYDASIGPFVNELVDNRRTRLDINNGILTFAVRIDNSKAFGDYQCSVDYFSGDEKKVKTTKSIAKVSVNRRESDNAFVVNNIDKIFEDRDDKHVDTLNVIYE